MQKLYEIHSEFTYELIMVIGKEITQQEHDILSDTMTFD